MKNRRWNREFPQVPYAVHMSVLDALSALEDQEEKKVNQKKRGIKKRTMLILAAAMAAALGMTAAASGIFKWNKQTEKRFEAPPELEDRLVLEEIAEQGNQTVSDHGLTIEAVQTIQDSNWFYALFEITAEDESILIDENCGMRYKMDVTGGNDPFIGFTWGFVDNGSQEVSNSRYFEMFGTKMDAEQYKSVYETETDAAGEDLQMNIQFTALTGPGEKAMEGDVLIEGDWTFALNIHPAKTILHEMNREFEINGCQVLIRSVELSPLSMILICDMEGIRALEKVEGVNLDQLDSLQSLRITGVKYEDGTEILQEYAQEREQYGDMDYAKILRFSSVVEPEKVSALLLGEERYEIPLK